MPVPLTVTRVSRVANAAPARLPPTARTVIHIPMEMPVDTRPERSVSTTAIALETRPMALRARRRQFLTGELARSCSG
jgi:hypothetical protein